MKLLLVYESQECRTAKVRHIFKRLMLYWIMRRSEIMTKIPQDYEYRDWEKVDALAVRFLELAWSSHSARV